MLFKKKFKITKKMYEESKIQILDFLRKAYEEGGLSKDDEYFNDLVTHIRNTPLMKTYFKNLLESNDQKNYDFWINEIKDSVDLIMVGVVTGFFEDMEDIDTISNRDDLNFLR